MLTKSSAYLFLETLLFKLKSKVSNFIKSLDVTIEKETLSDEQIQSSIIEEELKTIILKENLDIILKKVRSKKSEI
ncbi:hypothetical protein ACOSP6_10880 [Tenacibaculum sp. MEBiC06402]|uniref:hypothetical protein n=1 Tax=unclassified Tenacibaculum TaxID=2635139 RepID=UPI003B994D31